MQYFKRKVSLILALIMFFTISFSYISEAKVNRTLTAPTNLIASNVTTDKIDIKWSSVSGASGYYVYRAEGSDANYIKLATIYTTSFSNTGLKSSTDYFYYVKSFYKTTISNESIHLKVTTLTPVTPTPTPTPEPTPIPATTSKIIAGYATYYYTGDKTSYNSIVANKSTLDKVFMHTYTTDGIGNLTGLVSQEQIDYMKANNIKFECDVSNQFDSTVAKTLLESSANRTNLINNLLAEIQKYGYSGVNIDIENVPAIDRNYMTQFMQELYGLLNPKGYTVTIAVPAKTVDSSTQTWNYAFDYASLAKYSDQIVIMSYDEHYPGGTPGAIASIGWVENVVKYAVTVIPKEKILLGLAAYGYDWSSAGTKSYGVQKSYDLAATYGATINWDSVSQSPNYKYTDAQGIGHEVWFENENSIAYKLDLVNNYGLAGISIWRLGTETTAYMDKINSKLQ